jgi:hypothetical protein
LNFKFFSNHKYKSERLEKAATQVTIIRDNWDYSTCLWKTDADAVLACYTHNVKMISCIEMNYIEKIRSLIGNKGQSVLYNDLETRLIIDEKEPEMIMKTQSLG